MLNQFLNTLFPESCPVCREPSTDHKTAPICPVCWQSILPYSGPQCRKCGLPLVSDVSIECGECIENEPAYKFAGGFGLYDGALKKAIHLLKYHKIKRLSKPLSELIMQVRIPRVDAVLPVPLYKNVSGKGSSTSPPFLQNIWQRTPEYPCSSIVSLKPGTQRPR